MMHPMNSHEAKWKGHLFPFFSLIFHDIPKKSRKIIKDPSCHSCHGVFFKYILYHSSHRGPIIHWTIHDYCKGKVIGGVSNPSDKYHRQIGFIFPNNSGWTFPKNLLSETTGPSEKVFPRSCHLLGIPIIFTRGPPIPPQQKAGKVPPIQLVELQRVNSKVRGSMIFPWRWHIRGSNLPVADDAGMGVTNPWDERGKTRKSKNQQHPHPRILYTMKFFGL